MARHLIRSDQTLKAIRPGDPRKRISDGDGVYLLLFINGGSHGWRFSYSFHGRRKLLSLGTYPETGLALARQKAEETRQTLADDVDPSQKRKDDKAAVRAQWAVEERVVKGLPALDSFETLARDWFAVRRDSWAPSYSQKIIERLQRDVFRAGLPLPLSRRRCSLRCCDASKPGASWKRRAAHSRTAARSSATASRSAKPQRIRPTA